MKILSLTNKRWRAHEFLSLLKANDPSLHSLEIHVCPGYADEEDDDHAVTPKVMMRVGEAIGNNTQLTSLVIQRGGDHGDFEDIMRVLQALFNGGLVKNKSIKKTEFSGLNRNESEELIFLLTPLLEGNNNLESLKTNVDVLTNNAVRLILDCLKRRELPLSELHLHSKIDGGNEMSTAFQDRPEIIPKRLHLKTGTRVDEFIGMPESFTDPSCKLEELHVGAALTAGFNVDFLNELAIALSYRSSPLKVLFIGGINMGDRGVREFILDEFRDNQHLFPGEFYLRNNGITHTGMRILGDFLASRDSPLDALNIEHIMVQNEGLDAFLNAFQDNPDLLPKKLGFLTTGINSNALPALGDLLVRRSSPLEKLVLFNNDLGSHGLRTFVESFFSNPALVPKHVDLSWCNIGRDGLESISKLLSTENCSLESIDLDDHRHRFDEDTATDLAKSLSQNKKLRKLRVYTKTNNAARIILSALLDRCFDLVERNPAFLVEVLAYVNRNFAARVDDNSKAMSVGRRENNTLDGYFLVTKGVPSVFQFARPKKAGTVTSAGR